MRLARVGDWAAKLVNEHRAIRRTLVLAIMCMNAWISWQVFKDISQITAAAAAAYASAAGLLNAPLLFYFHHRHKEGDR